MEIIIFVIATFLVILYVSAESGLLAIGQEYLERKYGFPRKVKTGTEDLMTQVAKVVAPFSAGESGSFSGKVFVNGETWNAKAKSQLSMGERVQIIGISGLLLEVVKVTSPEE